MGLSVINGPMLNANLQRNGSSLSVTNTANSSPTLYIDVANNRVAINKSSATATLDVAGNIVAGNVLISNIGIVSASGNIIAGNVTTAGLISVTGNVISGNVTTIGLISATGNITGANVFVGNIVIPSIGNISVGNVNINNLSDPVQNQDAATKKYVLDNIGNIGSAGNLTFANTTISTNLSNGNITLLATGNQLVTIGGTGGLILPVGNTNQQPSPATTGTIRFNTTTALTEVYNGNTWSSISIPVTNQTLSGDGATTTFTLNRSTTTSAVLIMLNGITQVPGQSYSMSPSPSTNLVFTEAPDTGDVIDIRFLS